MGGTIRSGLPIADGGNGASHWRKPRRRRRSMGWPIDFNRTNRCFPEKRAPGDDEKGTGRNKKALEESEEQRPGRRQS